MGGFRIKRGRPTAGGGAPSFNASMTMRGSERKFVDLSAMLAAVPAGNMVAITPHTLSGLATLTLNVWQNPDQAVGAGYLYTKRELAKNLTVTSSAMADGSGLAWLSCAYNSGAGETGSPVTYVLGINIASAVTAYAYGAKTWARCGGPLISLFGNGAATAITAQTDKNGTATTAFEVFKGRLVWRSTDGTSTTHGRTRAVDYATSLTLSPFTVTLDNGAVVTVTAVDGQWDIAPTGAGVVNGSGSDADQLTNTVWGKQFARGDVILFEDGDYTPVSPVGSFTFVQHSLQLTGATSGNMPTAPSGYAVMDLEQAGWLTFKSRTPWGAKMGSYTFGSSAPDLAGSTTSPNVGSFYWRFTNLQISDEFRFESADATVHRYGWVQVDSCYMDVTASLSHTVKNVTASFFNCGTSTSPGGRHHIYVHDNWTKGNTFGVSMMAEDSEIVGNRIEATSEDAIRWGAWDTGTTVKSKCWWNFITGKFWGNSSHPDYIQCMLISAYQPTAATVYPVVGTTTDPTTFTSNMPIGSVLGNIGVPDSVGNHNVDTFLNAEQGDGTAGSFVPTNNGTVYQLDDGEGFLGGDVDDGRFYTWLYAGNIVVSSMSNGYYVKNSHSASRFDRNTMLQDWYRLVVKAANGYSEIAGLGNPTYIQNAYTTANPGTAKNSVLTGVSNWAGVALGGASNPTVTNCNTTAYDQTTAPAVFADPVHNWSSIARLQEVLDAVATAGAEAGRGAVADKTKVDHRNRTFDTAMFA